MVPNFTCIDPSCPPSILELWTGHFVGYYRAQDFSQPRIGDIFYVRMVSSVVSPTSPAAPISDLVFDQVGNVTDFAISQTNPVVCYYYATFSSPGVADPGNCSQTPSPAAGGGWYFGGRALGSGSSFDIRVPIMVKAPQDGISNGSTFGQRVSLIGATTSPAALAVHKLRVADRTPVFDTFSTTNVSSTGARTNANVYTFWKGGTAYFDLGTSPGSLPQASSPIALNNTSSGFNVFSTWSGLSPSTTYYWRPRVVVNGQTFTGAVQSFTTSSAGTSTSPTTNPTGGPTSPTTNPTGGPTSPTTNPTGGPTSPTTNPTGGPATTPPGAAPVVPARATTVVSGWPVRPVLARLGRTSVKAVVLPVTVRPARSRTGVVQSLSCRKVGKRTVCTWVKYRTVRWPSTATGRASVVLTAARGRTVTYRLVLPQTATGKSYVSRALVVRGA